MTEDEALEQYVATGNVLRATSDKDPLFSVRALSYWHAKDKLFEIRKASGKFPSDSCELCRQHPLCCKYGHHVGDCCIHCGNDKRNL
jgi:hypothetical protein